MPRNHVNDAHKWTTTQRITETIVYLYSYSTHNHLISLGCLSELNCNTLLKLSYRNGQHYSGILKASSIARCFERSIRYNFFLIDLESIQHKLSSDYSLNIYFSRCFPCIDGPSFSWYQLLQNVDFSKVGNMQFFFQELYSHIDKNSRGKVWVYVSRQNSKLGNLLKWRMTKK